MTSKLTRERLQEIAEDGFLKHGESKELARMALAAMDSEPVGMFRKSAVGYTPSYHEDAVPLYRHAQPAPEKYNIGDATMRHIFTPTGMTNASDMQAVFDRVEAVLVGMEQPAPVSLTEAQRDMLRDMDDEIIAALEEKEKSYRDGIRKCIASLRYHHKRAEAHSTGYKGSTLEDDTLKSINFLKRNNIAAMLQDEPVCTCPSGDGSLRWPCPVHPGNSPAQSDCCPAQNSVNPAQGGNYLVIPDEMTSEQAYEIGYYYGDPVDVFARGANWMRQHIIDSTLAAAPQSPGSEPATVPGKWIPVSERMPDNTEPVLCIEKRADFGTYGQPFVCWHDGGGWVGKTNYRPIVTHWMPLPAAPQEVSDA